MHSLLICVTPADYEQAVASLWETGTLGIIEEQEAIRAFFATAEEAQRAAKSIARQVIEFRQEDVSLSQTAEDTDCDPIIIGDRFFVASSRSDIPTPPSRLRLTVDAKSAFGSGRHESTQLMLQALERLVQPNFTVLDVGCGSGILAQAARLLGASCVFACDVDPNAISVVQLNAEIPVFAGSADAIKTSVADLVLANISARVVDAIAADLNRVVKPDGHILISGFISGQTPQKWTPEVTLQAGEWLCWLCKRDRRLAEETPAPRVHELQWW